MSFARQHFPHVPWSALDMQTNSFTYNLGFLHLERLAWSKNVIL